MSGGRVSAAPEAAPSSPALSALQQRLQQLHEGGVAAGGCVSALRSYESLGRIDSVVGTLIRARGVSAAIGEICELWSLGEEGTPLLAEVQGFEGDSLVLTPMGDTRGLRPAMAVRALGRSHQVQVGEHLLGRVLDGLGRPLDGWAQPGQAPWNPVFAEPPPALGRAPISGLLETGVRAVDAFLTCGQGQRVGIFAPAGCGKSTLLGMLARQARADVCVLALIGERGREVREFMQDCLGPEGLARSVLVVATSDRPALERARAALVATTIAEHFRDQGRSVLLLLDSVTRHARALREIGLAAGEPPTRRGFPPSVFSSLPRLFERAGIAGRGAITAFYTVLEESSDGDDPISEEVRSLLDGHIVLSRKLATQAHFPAIDVLASVSRVAHRVSTGEHMELQRKARVLMARYRELEMLISMGEYKAGQSAESDQAVAAEPALRAFLRQSEHVRCALDRTLVELQAACGE